MEPESILSDRPKRAPKLPLELHVFISRPQGQYPGLDQVSLQLPKTSPGGPLEDVLQLRRRRLVG
jgi:hypothetical protein